MPKQRKRKQRTAERRAKRPACIDPNQAYSIDETCAAIDVSRAQLYRLLEQKRIRLIPAIDSRPRVAGTEILRLLGAAA